MWNIIISCMLNGTDFDALFETEMENIYLGKKCLQDALDMFF